jgi:NADH dehydrogenase [ubiquinone] 1 alpha subcomplex assembly factor 7
MTNGSTSLALSEELRTRILERGPITVAEYIEAALFHPDFGYYLNKNPLGEIGDFVTAPEISQIFGELIGIWCVQVWEAMGIVEPIRLIELGPGRGTLMADALRAIRNTSHRLFQEIHVDLVEVNPILKKHQREALAQTADKTCLRWHSQFSDVPSGPAIVLANEFFDVFPVEQFEWSPEGWHRRRVGFDDTSQTFTFTRGEICDPELPDYQMQFELGAIFEQCVEGEALAAEISSHLVTYGGTALIIDYGHSPSGTGETLQAVRDHQKCPVLLEPGTADITHHLDFDALARAALSEGGKAFGPIPQGLFLGRLGIDERARALASNADHQDAVMEGVHRLIHPKRMGILFKAMAITGNNKLPVGFLNRWYQAASI